MEGVQGGGFSYRGERFGREVSAMGVGCCRASGEGCAQSRSIDDAV